ncbi:hypothetical protein PR003_g28080 [Phytophthora rubi]|uniref:Uncharacterized protein n=1 Tax=Phytophthora rubi TaxID=129364 RepID=A0A6A4C2R5_9STRA|nr:hypothetical protein PR002_g23703 [Phytophthora rubi]KAE9279990.1 hypothetical protein PR003_g28080 [Phytophthora rubi]
MQTAPAPPPPFLPLKLRLLQQTTDDSLLFSSSAPPITLAWTKLPPASATITHACWT